MFEVNTSSFALDRLPSSLIHVSKSSLSPFYTFALKSNLRRMPERTRWDSEILGHTRYRGTQNNLFLANQPHAISPANSSALLVLLLRGD